MSYILDALRKSEEERQKSTTKAPGSGYTFIKDTTPPRKKFAFGLILTGCMLLAAIILGGGWWWSQQDQAETADTIGEIQPISPTANSDPGQDTEITSVPANQEIAPPAAQPSSSLMPPPVPIDELPYISEMSADFQDRISQLTFSGHVYSPEPSLRMIMINDAVVREGDLIGTELSLEEITRNGVVIRHHQTRFRVKLF